MDKNLKNKILIATVIVSLAVVFIPVYFFALADDTDNNAFKVIDAKVIGITDGTPNSYVNDVGVWDADDTDGNDSSPNNLRVRTFDSVTYSVEYKMVEKQAGSTTGNLEGRKINVEVLIPSDYSGVLIGGDSQIQMLDSQEYNGNIYKYGTLTVDAPSTLGTVTTFDFVIAEVNTSNITNSNSLRPIVLINESTDTDTPSVIDLSSSSNACERTVNVTNPSTGETTTDTSNECGVTITGKEDYFISLYTGSKKENSNEIPVGIIAGLVPQAGDKGIKGLIVPNTLSFSITKTASEYLSFKENSFDSYKRNQGNRIDIDANNNEMPEIDNGVITGAINGDTVTITINNIDSSNVQLYQDQLYCFTTDYFLTTVVDRPDLSTITVDLTANYFNDRTSTTRIIDSYSYVVGNYSSAVDFYDSSITSGVSTTALPYGKANFNFGDHFVLRTSFDYTSASVVGRSGLTSLTNYIKIDNTAFELNATSQAGSADAYRFITPETTIQSPITLDIDNSEHQKVYFGFGEWNSTYFSATNATGCPNIDFNNKEQLMNLYGGPCLQETSSLKWAYSPSEEHDINNAPISDSLRHRPLIVKSTYVSSVSGEKINPGAAGTLELYGTIINNQSLSNSTHQIVTSATAFGENNNDLRYLGTESNSGDSLLKNPNNFIKTNYNFANKEVITLNANMCDGNNKCPVAGNTVLVSGVKVLKPNVTAHRNPDDINTVSDFYYYPVALKVTASAAKSSAELTFNTAYVDLYLPSYMILENDYNPTSSVTSLSSVRSKLGITNPLESDVEYKVYHYVLSDADDSPLSEDQKTALRAGSLSDFVVLADIDLITTPNGMRPEIYAVVDFEATNSDNAKYGSITPDSERYGNLSITLHNESPVTTKATLSPNYIEKGGNYTFNMVAYNHSESIEEGGYNYPTAELVYVLPYTNNQSKIGTTTYNVKFIPKTGNTMNTTDYKFYYRKRGVPANIISDESTGEGNADWKEWTDPTTQITEVIAIKVVKQSAFAPSTYFYSEDGLTINVKTVGSNEGNTFYNTFNILAGKPENYPCYYEEQEDCANVRLINYSSSTSKTSVYERVISGFVFEDYDYNGIFTSDETKLKGIPVSLYKIAELPENYDPNTPSTYVSENDVQEAVTVTGENGNYYFGGLPSGYYYVSYTIDNNKYIVTDIDRVDDSIPNSMSNNSSAALLPNTNIAVSKVIEFPQDTTDGLRRNTNLGLTIKKEMAISLNKYITSVSVTKDGRTDTYDYSNQNLTQVSINVLNPNNTHVQVKYSFSIENTKYFPGYVGMIIDSMPTDMTFNPNIKENQNWVMYDNLLYYNGLSGKLLLPNEKQYFELVLDLDLKQAGTYRNIVSARDLTLMGDELPIYDFSELNNSSSNNTEGGE